jgi:anthranilate phosphoribosyltransferase
LDAPSIESTLKHVEAGRDLSMERMCETIDGVMAGHFGDEQIERLLLALRHKGETVAEVAGAAAAMRKHVTPIRSRRTGVIDTCGTGGDGSKTLNISTAAALVVAAVGVPVAKHGNRGVTSRSGSADVLSALGVNIEAGVPCVQICLNELGICFCYAPMLHGAMRRVATVRRKLGVPTIFNILGPLANPASVSYQLIGVGRPSLRPLLAEALAMLGTQRAAVVHGGDGMDEVSLGGTTHVTLVSEGRLSELSWSPEEFGLPRWSREDLIVDGPEQSAAAIRAVLGGQRGAARDVIVANAAAALWVAGRGPSPSACVGPAAEAIDSGAAARLLDRLVDYSHR